MKALAVGKEAHCLPAGLADANYDSSAGLS